MTQDEEDRAEMERLERRAADGLLVLDNLRLKKLLADCMIMLTSLSMDAHANGAPIPPEYKHWRTRIKSMLTETDPLYEALQKRKG